MQPLFEDALVFDPAHSFSWPITSREFDIGLFHYSADLYGIADSEVLIVGLILIGFSATLRIAFEREGWIRRMPPVEEYFTMKPLIEHITHMIPIGRARK